MYLVNKNNWGVVSAARQMGVCGFEATQKGYFYQRAREQDIALARRTIQGQRFWPANFALWFFRPEGPCPPTWYNQQNSGRFKKHCFFQPSGEDCPSVY